MKILLSIVSIIFVFNLHAQYTTSRGNVRVETTRAGEYSPLSQLSPAAIGYKFFIQDTVMKNFNIEFQIEKHTGASSLDTIAFGKILHISTSFRFELIPDIKQHGTLLLMLYWAGGARTRIMYSNEGYQYKWKEFVYSAPIEKSGSPLLLIYEDKLNDDTQEKAVHALFQSSSFKNSNKESIVKKLYSVLDSFLLVSYATSPSN